MPALSLPPHHCLPFSAVPLPVSAHPLGGWAGSACASLRSRLFWEQTRGGYTPGSGAPRLGSHSAVLFDSGLETPPLWASVSPSVNDGES